MEVQRDGVSISKKRKAGLKRIGELTITIVTYPTCGKNLASDPYTHGISLDA
jgi:hypothetical protein